jgi:hypothetical protein
MKLRMMLAVVAALVLLVAVVGARWQGWFEESIFALGFAAMFFVGALVFPPADQELYDDEDGDWQFHGRAPVGPEYRWEAKSGAEVSGRFQD